MTFTVNLPKNHEVSCTLWWLRGPRWYSKPPLFTPFTVAVSVSPFAKGRLLVDRVECPSPLPDMNREDWTAICRVLKETLAAETGMQIGLVTPDLFMEMKDGMVK